MARTRRGNGAWRVLLPILVLCAAAFAWAGVYDFIVVRQVGAVPGFWARERLAAYGSFVLAPAVTFIPIARALRIPLYDLEAIVAWSTLAFVVAFVDPGKQPALPILLVFLVPLTMAVGTVFTLISAAIGFRLLTRRSQRYDFVRARRDGYLAAMFLVGCLLLALLGVLSWVNAALLALIVLLLEVFLLSRSPAPSPGPASTRE